MSSDIKKNNIEEIDSSKIKNKDIYIKPNKWQLISMIVIFFASGFLNYFLTNSIILTVQASLFCTLLTYVAFVDYKLKLVSDYSVLALFLIGLITIIPNLIAGYYSFCIYSVISAIIIPIPLFIGAIISSGGIGGGDVKLVSAIAMILGINRGLFALIFGLMLAVIIQLIQIKVKKLDKKATSFALVPYLAVSSIIMFFI